jgi:hypothetical protein
MMPHGRTGQASLFRMVPEPRFDGVFRNASACSGVCGLLFPPR